MTRATIAVLGATAALLVLLGLWLGEPRRPASGPPTRPGSRPAAVSGRADLLQDLMLDLLIVPLERQAAKPFALANLDGRPMALDDLKGRPLLLYFWATW